MDIKVLIVAGDWTDKGRPCSWLRTGPGGDKREWTEAQRSDRFVRVRINDVPKDFNIQEGVCTGEFDTTPFRRGLDLLPKVLYRWQLPIALVDLIRGEGKQRLLTLDDFEDRKV